MLHGYVSYKPGAHGNSFLYLNASDGDLEMVAHGILLKYNGLDPKQFDGGCYVVGQFEASPDGARFIGTLTVERITLRQRVNVDSGVVFEHQTFGKADVFP